MKLPKEHHQEDFPRHLSKFLEHVPERLIFDFARNVRSEIAGFPSLRDLLKDQHRLTFSLETIIAEFRSSGNLVTNPLTSRSIYDAVALVVHFSSICDSIEHRHARELGARIRGGIKNPEDLKALLYELQVAVLLSACGFDVTFPEATENGNFDILATKDGNQVEFECKMITADKGRRIHQREGRLILDSIRSELTPISGRLQSPMLVRVVFPDQPPKGPTACREIAKSVLAAVIGGPHLKFEHLRVEVSDIPPDAIIFAPDDPASPEALRRVGRFLESLGIRNRTHMVFGKKAAAPIIVSLECDKPDKVLPETIKTIAEACSRQLTGERPSVICVKFDAISANELVEIGQEQGEPTALRVATSRFINSGSSRRASQLVYMADGLMSQDANGAISRIGATYKFKNPNNEYSASLDLDF